MEAQGTFREEIELNVPKTGDARSFELVDLTVKGGTFAGFEATWPLPGDGISIGDNVKLTLINVAVRDVGGYGIRCAPWSQRPSSVHARTVSVTRARRGGVRADTRCSLDAEGLSVDSTFGDALRVESEYRIVNASITASASAYGPLVTFANSATGSVDGLYLRDNLSLFGAVACGELDRTLIRLDVKHRAPIFAGSFSACTLVDSNIQEIR